MIRTVDAVGAGLVALGFAAGFVVGRSERQFYRVQAWVDGFIAARRSERSDRRGVDPSHHAAQLDAARERRQ